MSVLGFAPFDLFPVPILALAALFTLWLRGPDGRAAFTQGFLFGLGFFGAGVSWVYVSLHNFGGMPGWLAALATALLCAFLALFPAGVGALQARVGAGRAVRLVAMPALWVLSEWLRGTLFTGFPWLAVGYSQVPHGPLAGYAPLLGVYGLGAAVAASAALLAWLFTSRRRWPTLAGLLVLWAGGALLRPVAWTQPVGSPLAVSLVQGNILQDLKWRPDWVMTTLTRYAGLVERAQGRLVILPEIAYPLYLDQVPPPYLDQLVAKASRRDGSVLIGLPERQGDDYYNSVFGLSGAGVSMGVYRKRHLVPFGEYIPLRPLLGPLINDVLHIPMSDFARGREGQAPLTLFGGHRAAIAVCYEDVFGEELIAQLPAATLLVNVSNDAWFGESIAPWQHLQISQTRALETGRAMLRATNTGVTAFIDEHGRLQSVLPVFTAGVLEGRAQGFTGATPFVRLGNAPVLVLALGVTALAFWRGRRVFWRGRRAAGSELPDQKP